MKTSIERRSFLKQCAMGVATIAGGSYRWTSSAGAQAVSFGPQVRFNPPTTPCGCFNLPSLEVGKFIHAQATRLIFQGVDLEQDIAAARSGSFPPRLQLAKDLSTAGIPVIATYHWIRKLERSLPAPDSAEWNSWLANAKGFVEVMGPYIVGITLDNEPITSYPNSDFLPNQAGIVPAIAWFKALAAMIRETVPQLLISSPALNTLAAVRNHPDSPASQSVRTFFEWARNDSNIDVVDVHCHVTDVTQLDAELSYAASQFPRGLIITEWSEAGRFRPWDPLRIDPAFAAKWKRDAALTNAGYIANCESHPVAGPGDSRVSLDEWNAFVTTAPIDQNFMSDAFAMIKKHRVMVANYGAAIQYGKPLFDLKQLYANLTVVPGPDGKSQPNYKFIQWFKAMAASA